MNVLVLGGGGREHALCATLARASSVDWIHCAPGNAGIAEVATCHPDVDATDGVVVVQLARDVGADLVVVGPETPLVAGVTDALRAADIAVFGPSAAAARIEGSKEFAKQVMTAAGVPTARYWSGDDPTAAVAALERFDPPYVIKADGLAAGKGVRICADRAAAETAIEETMVAGVFGDAGDVVVIEEFLDGPEVSVFALCDGTTCTLLAPAQDFKRALDGDRGPNTGGMGAWCPYPLDDALFDRLRADVFQPVLASGGYPGEYETGKPITGLDQAGDEGQTMIFHAGTARSGDDVVTAGGRVLSVSGLGDDVADARAVAYRHADRIVFEKMYRRSDIAAAAAFAYAQP